VEFGAAGNAHLRKRRWPTCHQLDLQRRLVKQQLKSIDDYGASLLSRMAEGARPRVIANVENDLRTGSRVSERSGDSIRRAGGNGGNYQASPGQRDRIERPQLDVHPEPFGGRDDPGSPCWFADRDRDAALAEIA
jgi:hypothetical protein